MYPPYIGPPNLNLVRCSHNVFDALALPGYSPTSLLRQISAVAERQVTDRKLSPRHNRPRPNPLDGQPYGFAGFRDVSKLRAKNLIDPPGKNAGGTFQHETQHLRNHDRVAGKSWVCQEQITNWSRENLRFSELRMRRKRKELSYSQWTWVPFLGTVLGTIGSPMPTMSTVVKGSLIRLKIDSSSIAWTWLA